LMSSRLSLSLDSMKERIKIAGGSCAIESATGKGTVIRASLPIDPSVAGGDVGSGATYK